MLRNYLEWLTDVPWGVETQDHLDLKRTKRILDKHHYGLERIKDRLLEFLAVRIRNPEHKGSILCLAGPPGTGKTSIALSVAEALGRKLHRVSLGGMRDEAEIKGHRRTYVGAMPARSSRGSSAPGRSTRSSYSTRSTSWAQTGAATHQAPCSRCSTPLKTTTSRITISTSPVISLRSCSSPRRTI